jgi:adenine deaminase
MDYSARYSERVTIKAVSREGRVMLPLPPGVAIAAMVPRHGQNTRPSLALLTGFGLQAGAVASTISHDSHNLAVVGRDPGDMLAAANELARVGGGLAAVKDRRVLAVVPLPIAGLMSPATVEQVALRIEAFLTVLPELGLPRTLPGKLMALGLAVIPYVRLTDLGLVDVDSQQFIDVVA